MTVGELRRLVREASTIRVGVRGGNREVPYVYFPADPGEVARRAGEIVGADLRVELDGTTLWID